MSAQLMASRSDWGPLSRTVVQVVTRHNGSTTGSPAFVSRAIFLECISLPPGISGHRVSFLGFSSCSSSRILCYSPESTFS